MGITGNKLESYKIACKPITGDLDVIRKKVL